MNLSQKNEDYQITSVKKFEVLKIVYQIDLVFQH